MHCWLRTAHLVRSNPTDIVSAISKIKHEIQLEYFEDQKLSSIRNSSVNMCSFCKQMDLATNKSRQRPTKKVDPYLQFYHSQRWYNQPQQF